MAVTARPVSRGHEFILDEDAYAAPERAYQGDAGYDVFAAKTVLVQPGRVARVETGVRVVAPDGWWCEVTDRSSMALKGQVCVGRVVDEGYVGRVGVLLLNTARDPFVAHRGLKVAQLVFYPRYVDPRERELPVRGEQRHGSTGA